MLYLHIPFCKQACHYCNFHFSTSLKQKEAMVEAILRELELQKDYLPDRILHSVYFGGGTPSLLEITDLERIFSKINQFFTIAEGAEITLEANPDDLSKEKIQTLRQHTPVNRLSIGIQSFHEADLRWMNRAHSALEAQRCIELAHSAGFHDLSIDLIYGSPTTTDDMWKDNVQRALDFGVPHLSCYCLTVEEGTALGHQVKKGIQKPMDEERATRQFEYLMEATKDAGFIHYEISNFAQPGREARHNSNYWRGKPYLGIGPSAHSYNGVSRQWNIANNALYIKGLASNELTFEREFLSPEMRYNEYVMTSLRTIWGCDVQHLTTLGARFKAHFEQEIQVFLQQGTVLREGTVYRLSRAGLFVADAIAAELFWV
jgi:oxygen-independent coproporphyrinogen III oxidase